METKRPVARKALGGFLAAAVVVVGQIGATPMAHAVDLTATSPGGDVTITIDGPTPHTLVPAGTPVAMTGTASGGDGATAGMNVIYVIDVSGSTASPGGACGDLNGDGSGDTLLDCEIAGLMALNTSLGTADIDVSLVSFSLSAQTNDVGHLPGVQTATKPTTDSDENGTHDVVDALQSLQSEGGTDFDAALAQVQPLLVAGEQNFVIFLSDGESSLSTGPGSHLQAVAEAGATVLTFAVGVDGAGCGAGSPLAEIAITTGGTCTEVPDPSQLSTALAGVNLSGVERVEVEVNGVVGIAALDPLGRFSFVIPADVLQAGRNDIVARAFEADAVEGEVAVASTFVVRRGTPGPRP